MDKQSLDKLLAASRGTQLGALIRAAYGLERDAIPRFTGKGVMTSDGFIMANFIDQHGIGHMGAFVGSHADYDRNVKGIAAHCDLSPANRAMFFAVMDDWSGAVNRAVGFWG